MVSVVISMLTAAIVAAINWGVSTQKIERLTEELADVKLEQREERKFRLEQAAESQLVRAISEDVKVIRADVKALDAKVSSERARRKR